MKKTQINVIEIFDELTPCETSVTNKQALPARIIGDYLGYGRRFTAELLSREPAVETAKVYDEEQGRVIKAYTLAEQTVDIMPNGEKYHTTDCRVVDRYETMTIPIDDVPEDYVECSHCSGEYDSNLKNPTHEHYRSLASANIEEVL